MLLAGLAALALVIAIFSAGFADIVLAAAGTGEARRRRQRRRRRFRAASIRSVLRRKEWVLLRRDPWLVSQSLMQILYLLPPALILWRYFGDDVGAALLILVPVLVMAAGQLAGGLAWLAVSGEDAPDLVASAPLAPRAVISAKIEAVMILVLAVVLPLLAALALAAPRLALVAALFIAVAAGSGSLVQIWFRSQAKRSHFRHRQTSSRVATLAEALGSVLWAGTAALAAAGSWFAAGTGAAALLTLLCTWLIRPRAAGGV